MRAMVFHQVGSPLKLEEVPTPQPKEGQVLIKIECCAVCRTDLHIVDGELTKPKLPLILGHQIVGKVVEGPLKGQRVGVPWLGHTCGSCEYCKCNKENLCDTPTFTGYTTNGGFAEFCCADPNFIFPLPKDYPSEQAAPLLCGGLIGYRAYRMTADALRIGFYGFGSAAHLLTPLAAYEGKKVYAFTKPKDKEGQAFALKKGAIWSGDSTQPPPEKLDAAIIFAPVGALVVEALKHLKKGGVIVCAGIHMSPIPSFDYDLLWGERQIRSVANLTRQDGKEFLEIAPKVPIHPEVTLYSLEKANEAIDDLKKGRISGSAVIRP